MRKTEDAQAVQVSVSRRQFLKGTTGITFMLALGTVASVGRAAGNRTNSKTLSIWVRMDSGGAISIYYPVAEMGQGASTALPLILAEEMDADWSRVSVEHSPIDADSYGHNSVNGKTMMITVGSFSVRAYFDRLRIAGAQVRQVLVQNAAIKLNVPVNELSTEASTVYHRSSGKSLSYGQLVEQGTFPATLPRIETQNLKPIDQYRLIGKTIPRLDLAAKTNGSAQFSIDVELPGMLYGMIQRAPVNGAAPLSSNADDILTLKDITKVVQLDHGVGIIGRNMWAVMQARKKLNVIWTKGAVAESFSTATAVEEYGKLLSNGSDPTTVITSVGTVPAVASATYTSYDADYLNQFVYHAQIEPLNAVAKVSADHSRAELWVGSQFPSGLRAEVAKLLTTDISNVTIHPCYLGGGFGRRSWHDFGLEAVQLAKASGTPVKLIWSREDDLQNGAFRPMSVQRLSAEVDAQGAIASWSHRTVGDDFYLCAAGSVIPFYTIANQQVEFYKSTIGIRTKHWRAVSYGPNKYAIESFIDEIAVGQGTDPYQFRRRLLANSPRALAVLDAAVQMSPWGTTLAQGKALGLAFAEGVGSLTAGVVEISLDQENGKIIVHRVFAAIDSGLVIQPDNAIRQHQGAILQGVSSALLEAITIENGVVQQSNFHDYPLLTMAQAPEVTVKLISSESPPAGIGEAALPFTAAAIGNAFANLTGKRLRNLPFSAASVKASLGA